MSIFPGKIFNNVPVPIRRKIVVGGSPLPPAATEPDDLANLELWFKADAIVGLNDGDNITTWPDSSGNGRDAGVGGGGFAPPVYKVNRINSKPAGYFENGLASVNPPYTVTNPFTIFVVYNRVTSAASNLRALNGQNNWLLGPYSGTHQYYNGAFIQGPAVVTGVFVYAIVTSQSPGGAVFRVNGAQVGTNGNTTTPGNSISLGARGGIPESLFGDIAEMGLYSRALNSTEITSIETYLATKYGL